MEIKKSKGADLENKLWALKGLGIVVSAAIVLMAFTYKSVYFEPIKKLKEKEIKKNDDEKIFEIQELETPPPPPPAQVPPTVIEEVEEVEDDVEDPPVETIDETLQDEVEIPEEEPEEITAPVIIDVAEVDPAFPGGEAAMAQFINDNFEYPEISKEMGEQGTVYVQFVVYKDGKIKDVKVIKGVSPAIDKEAIRVVKKMPPWTPGEQAGKKVNVRYVVPIKVKLG